jgi:hypothetical protein
VVRTLIVPHADQIGKPLNKYQLRIKKGSIISRRLFGYLKLTIKLSKISKPEIGKFIEKNKIHPDDLELPAKAIERGYLADNLILKKYSMDK